LYLKTKKKVKVMDSNAQEEPDQDITIENSFVWAKLGGHPFWPAQVVAAAGTGLPQKKGQVIVKFYGTNDYASVKVSPEYLKSYDEFKDQKPRKKRNKNFLKAVKQIERAMKGEPVESDNDDKHSKKRKMDTGTTATPAAPPPAAAKDNAKKGRKSRSRTQSPRNNRTSSPASSSKSSTEPDETFGPVNGARTTMTTEESNTSLEKVINQVPPSEDRIGFIGCGIMGTPMALNLKKTGHNVACYNRTHAKTQPLKEAGITVYETLRQVIENCDIVFACVSDPKAARDIVFGQNGILQYVNSKKAYVDMSTVDPETAEEISQAIKQKGGRFLEAPVSGSKKPAETGELIIMCAGDRSLYVDCYTMFEAMSKKWFFMGDVGTGARMKIVVNGIMGAHMAALAEGMALAEKCDLDPLTLLEILSLGALSSPLVTSKGSSILEGDFPSQFPLKHQQKDLRLAVGLSEDVAQPLSVIGASNELFKRAVAEGYGERDMASVYRTLNHSPLEHS